MYIKEERSPGVAWRARNGGTVEEREVILRAAGTTGQSLLVKAGRVYLRALSDVRFFLPDLQTTLAEKWPIGDHSYSCCHE